MKGFTVCPIIFPRFTVVARRLKFAPNNFPVSQRVLNQKHQTPRGERSCIASWTKNLMTCRNREEQKRKEGTAKSRLVFTLGRLLNQNSRKQIFLLMSVCLGDFFGSYLYSRAKSNEIKFEKGTWAERKIPNPSPILISHRFLVRPRFSFRAALSFT